MAIPDYQAIMFPLLKHLSDKQEHKTRDVIEHLSDQFNLTKEEREELLPSGLQQVINNRVGWARTYMIKAGLLLSTSRGYIKIAERGLTVLKQKPQVINVKYLEQFPEFREFRAIRKETSKEPKIVEDELDKITPDELMEKGYTSINASLAQELLNTLRNISPSYFERVVGNLLSAMGYGKCMLTGGSGDKGVDGIVNQDKLGLDRIFFQAKRYDENNSVTARDVRDFVGTLDLHGISKGIFITTSRFPKDTCDILNKTPKNIILIDGPNIAKLMIEHSVGVSTEKTYIVKRIDSDYFLE